jgi:biopolymer transport protein ExbB
LLLRRIALDLLQFSRTVADRSDRPCIEREGYGKVMNDTQTQQVERSEGTRHNSSFRFELLVVALASLLSWSAFAEGAPTTVDGPSKEPSAASSLPAGGFGTTASPSDLVRSSTLPAAAITPPVPPPVQASDATSSVGPLPAALSPWGMFVHADLVVKAVMIGLALASVATWTVLLVKTFQLRAAKREARRASAVLLSARSFVEGARHFAGQRSAVARLLAAAEDEVDKSQGLAGEGIKERVAWQLERIEIAAGQHIGRGMGILATVGAVAPFVGLFGTVWGIMNSFIGISRAHTTNLAVVAPGIAEALLATAFGLVAAIPAVVIYNAFARSTGTYRALLGDASVAILRLLSRDLDRSDLSLDVGRDPHAADAPALSIVESAE